MPRRTWRSRATPGRIELSGGAHRLVGDSPERHPTQRFVSCPHDCDVPILLSSQRRWIRDMPRQSRSTKRSCCLWSLRRCLLVDGWAQRCVHAFKALRPTRQLCGGLLRHVGSSWALIPLYRLATDSDQCPDRRAPTRPCKFRQLTNGPALVILDPFGHASKIGAAPNAGLRD